MLPYQLSETNFRRFEPILLQAQQTHPLPVKFDIPGLAGTTAAARCRDALLAYKRNRRATVPWATGLDETIVSFFKVYTTEDGLWVGKDKPAQKAGSAASVVQTVINSRGWTRDDYKALCWLIQNQRIEGGVTVPHIDQDTQLFLESNYNIAITHNPDGTSLIV